MILIMLSTSEYDMKNTKADDNLRAGRCARRVALNLCDRDTATIIGAIALYQPLTR